MQANEITIVSKEFQNGKWSIEYTYRNIKEFNSTKLISDDQSIVHQSVASPNRKLPSAALFLVDTSKSMKQSFVQGIKSTIEEIFTLKNVWDHWAIAGFDADLNITGDFNQTTPVAALGAIRIKGKRTELYRAALEGIKKLQDRPEKRKFLILFSDGESEDISYKIDDVIREANKHKITILSFGYKDTIYLQSLRKLSEDTQGKLWIANKLTNKVGDEYKSEISHYFNDGGLVSFTASQLLPHKQGEQKVDLVLQNDSNQSIETTLIFPVKKPKPKPKSKANIKPIEKPTNTLFFMGLGGVFLAGLLYLLLRPKKEKDIAPETNDELVEEVKEPMAYFETVSGAKIYIYLEHNTIGALDDNDIVLAGDYISRYHAILDYKNNKYYIIDHNSQNGIKVNNDPANNQEIKNGDTISFGPLEVTFKTLKDKPNG